MATFNSSLGLYLEYMLIFLLPDVQGFIEIFGPSF